MWCLSARATEVDFDALAAKTKTEVIGTEDLPKVPSSVLFEAAPVAKWSNGDDLHGWLECKKVCKPIFSYYHESGDNVDLKTRIYLPVPLAKPISGLKYRDPAIANLNGVAPQVIVRYEVYAAPRPGLGSLLYEYLAILNVPDLSLALFHEIDRGGEASSDARCSWSVDKTSKGLRFKDCKGKLEEYSWDGASHSYKRGG
jgi:hypothetical protein